jgi:endonuclease-3 related protein
MPKDNKPSKRPFDLGKRVLRARPATVGRAYERMFAAYGPQDWWPGDTTEEIIIGAVLTQNTSWKNVEKALRNLRVNGGFGFKKLARLRESELAERIRPAGYYNLKARRLLSVVEFFLGRCDGAFERLAPVSNAKLRDELLATYGVGPETADSILLYAFERRVFVVDAYTIRIGGRHGWFPTDTRYEEARSFFERSFPPETALYNEAHALLVRVGNRHCRPHPICEGCPLNAKGCGRIRL